MTESKNMPESKVPLTEDDKGRLVPAKGADTKETQTVDTKDTQASLLDLMHDFIAAIQTVDKTTTEAPEAEKALLYFRRLVEGVK